MIIHGRCHRGISEKKRSHLRRDQGQIPGSKTEGGLRYLSEAPGGDGDAFVERAIAHNLFIIPGSVFSRRKSHVRISFAAEEGTVLRGIEILRKLS